MAEPIKETTRLADRLEEMDAEILAWAKLTRRKLLEKLIMLGVEDKVKLSKTVTRIRRKRNGDSGFEKEEFLTKSLSKYLRKKEGEIESVGFSFARHGIFIEHGVGAGRPVNSSNSSPYKQPWISVVIPQEIDALADIIENRYADIVAAELKINIPGIYTTKVSGNDVLTTTDDNGKTIGVVIDRSFF